MKWCLLFPAVVLTTSLHAQCTGNSLTTNNDSTNTCILKEQVAGKSRSIINPVSIAAGYAALCFLSYNYADEEVEEYVMSHQNITVYNSFKTIGYAGLGTSNLIITAGTGISALITKDKRLGKATILLAGAHLINDFATNQLKVSVQRHRPNTGDPYNTFDWRELRW